MNSPVSGLAATSAAVPDAEVLYAALLAGVQALIAPGTRLAGIASGGAWLAERVQRDLVLPGEPGILSSGMHRDDFAQRGLASMVQTTLPFDVNGADILVLDDVLHTGRTLRAVLNELYDYGRPARVRLAVLVDRDGRELPVQADFAALRMALPSSRSVALARSESGGFSLDIKETTPC